MSPDAVVRAWFKEVWDEGNEDAIDRLMAPDAVAHGLGPDGIRGPEAFKPYVRAMRGALGDLEVEVVQTLTDGDRVAAHCHVVARHVGTLFGAAANPAAGRFLGHHDRPRQGWPDRRGMELLRLPADVSADGMGQGSAAPGSSERTRRQPANEEPAPGTQERATGHSHYSPKRRYAAPMRSRPVMS